MVMDLRTGKLRGSFHQKSCCRYRHRHINDFWAATGGVEEAEKALQYAGANRRRKLIDPAVELLGYHRKSAIRVLSSVEVEPVRRTNTGQAVQLTPGP